VKIRSKKKPTRDGFNKKGLCRLCEEPRTPKGHDPCIANLPGVLYACCGHGEERGYIKFEDGRVLNFTPRYVTLDRPKNFWVHKPLPIHIKGDKYRVLNFKKRKKKTKKGFSFPYKREGDGWKLLKESDVEIPKQK